MEPFNKTDSPKELQLVVAFTDVTGFAKEFQRRTDREMFDLMSQFYELIGNHVQASGGTVVKFMGDASLLVYPADDTRQAVQALRQLSGIADDWLKRQGFEGKFCVRAHVGSVVCGPIGTGSDKRFDVLGAAVNVTALLEHNGFILSPELQMQLA